MKNALRKPLENYEVRRTLLLWYEASLWGAEAPGYIVASSVEHLLPNNPAPASRWMTDFKDPDERYWAHGSLGNLALVESRLQETLGIHDFPVKRSILMRESQFERFRSTAGIVSHVATAWTAVDIEARTAAMSAGAWEELLLREPSA